MLHLNHLDQLIYQQGYALIDDFLSIDHANSLLNSAQKLNEEQQFTHAKIGGQAKAQHQQLIRRDKIYWLNEQSDDPAIQAYFMAIQKIAQHLNQSLFLGLFHFESHFAIYQVDDFYRKHIDQFATNLDRRISCVYYLNNHWQDNDGGELKLYDEQEQLVTTILPIVNRFICFNSHLLHEVCTTKKTRYSIAGWLKTRTLSS